MHTAVHAFIKEVKKEYPYKFRNKKVLECGSQNVNGSPRQYFWGFWGEYIGVDIYPGKGVDVVLPAHAFERSTYFDVVISTEMLEHDENWKKSLRQMYYNLSPGGLMLITCAGPHRREHGTRRTTPFCSPGTPDYYRNISVEDFEQVLPMDLFDPYVLQYARGKSDLQFYGIKRTPTSREIYRKLQQTLEL